MPLSDLWDDPHLLILGFHWENDFFSLITIFWETSRSIQGNCSPVAVFVVVVVADCLSVHVCVWSLSQWACQWLSLTLLAGNFFSSQSLQSFEEVSSVFSLQSTHVWLHLLLTHRTLTTQEEEEEEDCCATTPFFPSSVSNDCVCLLLNVCGNQFNRVWSLFFDSFLCLLLKREEGKESKRRDEMIAWMERTRCHYVGISSKDWESVILQSFFPKWWWWSWWW